MKTMVVPTVCHMPEVVNQGPALRACVLLQDAFVGDPGWTEKGLTLRKHFIRLVDQTIREYASARLCVLAQVEEEATREPGPTCIYMFNFVEHLENCFITCRRALHILEGLKKEGLVDRPRRRLVEARKQVIVDIRNSVEHMGEALANSELPDGEVPVPYLSEDGYRIELTKYSVRVDDLAAVLRDLQSIAASLLPAPKATP